MQGDSPICDPEEEIEKHTVLAPKRKQAHQIIKKSEEIVAPLLINDIREIPWPSTSKSFSIHGVQAGLVLIYGIVCRNGSSGSGTQRYLLDDGTGLIKLTLCTNKHLPNIAKIGYQCSAMLAGNKELRASIQNILQETRLQMNDFNAPLPFGTRALVIGRPSIFHSEVIFFVYHMHIDHDKSNELELAVKQLIIEWYSNKYKSHPPPDI